MTEEKVKRKDRIIELQKRRSAMLLQLLADKEIERKKIELARAEHEAERLINDEVIRQIESELNDLWYEEEIILHGEGRP